MDNVFSIRHLAMLLEFASDRLKKLNANFDEIQIDCNIDIDSFLDEFDKSVRIENDEDGKPVGYLGGNIVLIPPKNKQLKDFVTVK